MLDTARQHLRETVATGDTPRTIEDRVAEAAPGASEETRSALWLYAWHRAGDGDELRRRRVRAREMTPA